MRLYLLAGLILIGGCARTPEEIQVQINKLTAQETSLKQSVRGIQQETSSMRVVLDSVRSAIDYEKLNAYIAAGGQVRYRLRVELRQKREGFDQMDLDAQMKDNMNAVEFTLYVDRQTYNEVNRGDKLIDQFRKGSAMMEGSHSSWVIRVMDKEIIKI